MKTITTAVYFIGKHIENQWSIKIKKIHLTQTSSSLVAFCCPLIDVDVFGSSVVGLQKEIRS